MTQLPGDLLEAKDAAREFGIPYSRLRNWWTRGKISKWQRGDGRVLLQRSEIERMLRVERIMPRDEE